MTNKISTLYKANVQNRYFIYKKIKLKFSNKFHVQAILLSISYFVKIGISKFLRKSNQSKKIESLGIVWGNLFLKRLTDLPEEPTVTVFYKYRSFSLENISVFRKISFLSVLKWSFELKKNKLRDFIAINDKEYYYDSFWYRIIFICDYLVVQNILDKYNPQHLYIAGLMDRLTIISTEIAASRNIKVHMLQHGVFGLYKDNELYPIKVDCFYYSYNFSKKYLGHFLDFNRNPTIEYLPQKQSKLKLSTFKSRNGVNIGFATTPAKEQYNVDIIAAIISVLPISFNLIIYTHPRDTISRYQQFDKHPNVFFFPKERHGNLEYLISRYSTLGVEYAECGISPIFVNIDKMEVDFLESDDFLHFDQIEPFISWFRVNSTKLISTL